MFSYFFHKKIHSFWSLLISPFFPCCTPVRDLGSSPKPHFGATPSQLAVSPDGRWFATGLGKDVYTWKQPVTWAFSTDRCAGDWGFLGICPGSPRINVANVKVWFVGWDGTRSWKCITWWLHPGGRGFRSKWRCFKVFLVWLLKPHTRWPRT